MFDQSPKTEPQKNQLENVVPLPNYENNENDKKKIVAGELKTFTPLKSQEDLDRKIIENKMKEDEIRKKLERAFDPPYRFSIGKNTVENELPFKELNTGKEEINKLILSNLKNGDEVVFKNKFTGEFESGFVVENINPETQEINLIKKTNIGGGITKTIKPEDVYDSYKSQQAA